MQVPVSRGFLTGPTSDQMASLIPMVHQEQVLYCKVFTIQAYMENKREGGCIAPCLKDLNIIQIRHKVHQREVVSEKIGSTCASLLLMNLFCHLCAPVPTARVHLATLCQTCGPWMEGRCHQFSIFIENNCHYTYHSLMDSPTMIFYLPFRFPHLRCTMGSPFLIMKILCIITISQRLDMPMVIHISCTLLIFLHTVHQMVMVPIPFPHVCLPTTNLAVHLLQALCLPLSLPVLALGE